ncbi:MAG: hypothetical protein HYX76_06820 [Acidobacteria bacterium]|nr:hypothetical protein [Acidobacteriota bacterium]
MNTRCLLVALSLVLIAGKGNGQSPAPDSRPAILTFDELRRLSSGGAVPPDLSAKVRMLLTTPFVSNAAARQGLPALILQAARSPSE